MIEFFSRRRAAIEARYAQLVRDYRARARPRPGRGAATSWPGRPTSTPARARSRPSLADKRAAWREELTARFGRARSAADGRRPRALRLPPQTLSRCRLDIWPNGPWRLCPRAVPPGRCGTSAPRSSACSAPSTFPAAGTAPRDRRRGHRARGPRRTRCPWRHPRCSTSPPNCAARTGSRCSPSTALPGTPARPSSTPSSGWSTAPGPPPPPASPARGGRVLDGFEARTGAPLDAGQRHLVTAFACDRGCCWPGSGRPGRGRRPRCGPSPTCSGRAGSAWSPWRPRPPPADVLGRELGVRAENLHKFLHEWTRGPFAARLRAGAAVPAGAHVPALPRRRGARRRGRHGGHLPAGPARQIAAHAARSSGCSAMTGSCPRSIRRRAAAGRRPAGTPELSVLYRFRDPAEAAATLQLRAGDAAAVDWYASTGGSGPGRGRRWPRPPTPGGRPTCSPGRSP